MLKKYIIICNLEEVLLPGSHSHSTMYFLQIFQIIPRILIFMDLKKSGSKQEQASALKVTLNQEDDIQGDNLLNSHEQIPQEFYAALTDLPLGYRFAPKNHELINDYLNKKINKEPALYNLICSVDVYNYSPQELTEKYPSLGEDEWYFFTPRDRKYPLGKQRNRAAGDGYWKRYNTKEQIYHNNICTGSKISFIFYDGEPPNEKKTKWAMKEYMVEQPSRQQNGMLLNSCVLCRISTKICRSSSKSCKTKNQETFKFSANEN